MKRKKKLHKLKKKKKICNLERELTECSNITEHISEFNEYFSPDIFEEHLKQCGMHKLLIPVYKIQYTNFFNKVYRTANIHSYKKSSL